MKLRPYTFFIVVWMETKHLGWNQPETIKVLMRALFHMDIELPLKLQSDMVSTQKVLCNTKFTRYETLAIHIFCHSLNGNKAFQLKSYPNNQIAQAYTF